MLDRKALGILFCTLFLLMLGVGIIIPNIAYRAQEISASAFQISLLFTLYSLMQFLFAPLWGHLSARVGRKPILMLGLLGNGVGLLLFGIASSLPRLFPSPAQAFRNPLLPFYLVAFAVPFAMAALETTFPLLIQARFGYGAHDMGWMFLFMGTAVFLVQAFFLGRLIQAMGEQNVM